MILLDFSGSIFAALHVDIRGGQKPHMEYIRHLVMNTIRAYNTKYRDEWGEMHIILDSTAWRNEVFKFYKWERKNTPDEENDWDEIMEIIADVQNQMAENLPYPVLKVDGAEADDIIGYICQTTTEPTLIVSSDKDFGALLENPLIKQTRPCDKMRKIEFVKIEDPAYFEHELILAGDKADGIPSVRCPDDFIKCQLEAKWSGEKNMRAPAVTQKFKQSTFEFVGDDDAMRKAMGDEVFGYYERNRKLISLKLKYLPEHIIKGCEEAMANRTRRTMVDLKKFMMAKRMSLFLEKLPDFKPNLVPVKAKTLFDL